MKPLSIRLNHNPGSRILAILLILSGLFIADCVKADEPPKPPQGFELFPAAQPLGDLRFLDAQGKTVPLSDFKGRMVLLNLWATWCPSCRLEMPSLEKLQHELGPEGLIVLPVSVDEKGFRVVPPYYRESNIRDLPMFFDPAFSLMKQLQVPGVPVSILISRDGWEMGRLQGSRDWSTPDMLIFLRRLLNGD